MGIYTYKDLWGYQEDGMGICIFFCDVKLLTVVIFCLQGGFGLQTNMLWLSHPLCTIQPLKKLRLPSRQSYPLLNQHNSYGKSAFSICTSTTTGPFSIAMLVYQRPISFWTAQGLTPFRLLDHLPPVLPKRELRMEERMKLSEILESSVLLAAGLIQWMIP